jgi:hypothetical protein
MKKYLLFLIAATVLACVGVRSAGKTETAKYEFAIVKWDGPDRLYYNMPDKFELVHLRAQRINIPRDAQEEEWCLTYAANQLAKEGWETLTLDSRRILLRREKR